MWYRTGIHVLIMEKIFFDSWDSIIRTAIISVVAYIGLLLMLRVAGNRPLTQLNAFDFIVNVAIGSTLATVMLNKDVVLADGLLTFALLIIFQLVISYLSKKSGVFNIVIKTNSVLLFYNGEFLDNEMKRHLLTKEELLQAVRSQGISSIEQVKAIILETNGRFSVLKNDSESIESVFNTSNHRTIRE
jgi:uncharacterized membrane protein YcaP (DUF421 family)